MAATFQYCLDNQILGVGWRVDGLANTQNWNVYKAQAEQEYGPIQQPQFIKNKVRAFDLAWTRAPAVNTIWQKSQEAGSIG